MKTTDFTLAEIDDYIAVRKLVTRKEMRLAHEYEKTLEWRHMEKLHALQERFVDDASAKYNQYCKIIHSDETSYIPGKAITKSTRGWQNIEHDHIEYDDCGLPCKVNGIEIPEHLRRTLDLILSHGKNRQVSINLIMCDNSSNYQAAERKYDRNISAIMAIFGLSKKPDVCK